MWVCTVQSADQTTTMAILSTRFLRSFDGPRIIYSDNRSHLVGKEMQKMLKMLEDHGVIHLKDAICHPSSVGLVECYGRLIIGNVRLQFLQSQYGSEKICSRERYVLYGS
jgi:hypothetical protein